MDNFSIEKLNKSQIILLTLLTSFVTSIATGIVTVSLMDQAPPAITQTVNRVVERTVEKVMPAVQTAAAGITKTIVIKESDLIASAIEHVRPSVVRLYSTDAENSFFMGFGLVLTKSGMIVADTRALGETSDALIEQSNGQHVRAFVTRRDSDNGFAYLTAATTTSEGKSAVWTPSVFSSDTISLGQTVFTIAGRSTTRVADGIITAIDTTDGHMSPVDTNIPSDAILPGSPLVDTNGTVVGISTGMGRDTSSSAFIPSSAISPEPKSPEPAP
ncbi:MAG: S1C family serine protease [bacterium]|nr:S1C family serine protease [bacterium]